MKNVASMQIYKTLRHIMKNGNFLQQTLYSLSSLEHHGGCTAFFPPLLWAAVSQLEKRHQGTARCVGGEAWRESYTRG